MLENYTCRIVPVSKLANLQLLPRLLEPLGVGRVDDVDEDVRVVKVVAPVGPDLSLPANVPHVELEPLCLYRLDVEALKEISRLIF